MASCCNNKLPWRWLLPLLLLLVVLLVAVLNVPLASALCSPPDFNLATVAFDSQSPSSSVDDAFVCATLDWWPPEKCDYGTCSWGHASILNLNLSHPVLHNAVKAFSPLKIRLGGSLQDIVVYHVGQTIEPCVPFVRNQSAIFGFSGGCLPMWRWNELNAFFQSVGCQVAFGLNALYGRDQNNGAWNPSNARDFIQYTHDRGYNISAWEFGNELSGSGVGTRVAAQQYAVDMKMVSTVVKGIYADHASPPLLVAPDGFFDKIWTQNFLQASGQDIVDVLTHHIYNLGPGVDTRLMEKILDPSYLDGEAATFQTVQGTLRQYGPWANSWVGEAGGAYNSGHHLVTDAFVSGFWYLDQFGMAAKFGTKSYCRQSLIGGNYGLLNTTTFHPNPDYYGALLWSRLMGAQVLATQSLNSTYLRAYAHCSKNTKGVTFLLLNLSNQTTFAVSFSTQPSIQATTREEYHLTPKDGDLHSQTSLLNGAPLELTAEGHIPALIPQVVSNKEPVCMKPLSIAFISIPSQIPACS